MHLGGRLFACFVTFGLTAVVMFGKMGKAAMVKLAISIRDAIGFKLQLKYKRSTGRLTITNHGGNAAKHAFAAWAAFTEVVFGAINKSLAGGEAFYGVIERFLELYGRCGRVWFCETVDEAAACGRDFAFDVHELISMQLLFFGETPPTLLYLFGPGIRELWDYLDLGVAPFSVSASASEHSVGLRRQFAPKHLPILGHGYFGPALRCLNMVRSVHEAQHCAFSRRVALKRYNLARLLRDEERRVAKERLVACALPVPRALAGVWMQPPFLTYYGTDADEGLLLFRDIAATTFDNETAFRVANATPLPSDELRSPVQVSRATALQPGPLCRQRATLTALVVLRSSQSISAAGPLPTTSTGCHRTPWRSRRFTFC